MTKPDDQKPDDQGQAPRPIRIDRWSEWHDEYDDPDSELALRMRTVRKHVAATVEACPPGPVTVVSICAGQGREVIGALEDHPRRGDVRGRLVELDPDNAAFAKQSAEHAHLDGLEIVNGDASVSDAYAGLPRADLVVMSGLFGHLDDEDRVSTIAFLRQILRSGGHAVWTSFLRDNGPVEKMRRFFVEQSFDEVETEFLPGEEYRFTVTLSRHAGSEELLQANKKLFTFGSAHKRRREPRPDGPAREVGR
jgi:hypothetical protein